MPTKKNPDMTTGAKLLKLFRRLLLDGKKHYLQDLAQWLDCSPQTVIRLIGEIENEIGTNLEIGQENRKRWYRISPSSQGFALDTAELRYLTLCKELASPYLPEQVRGRIEQSIASFSHVLLETSLAAKNNVASQYTFFSKGRIDYTPHFEHLKQLENAIEEKRICLITYRAAGKVCARELPFAPSRIIGMNNAFYVIGAKLSDDLSEVRHFINLAVHRILSIESTDSRFTGDMPEDNPSLFGLPWHEPKTFFIRFSPGKVSDYVRERVWSDSQKLFTLPDASVLLEITTCSEPELMAWLRSYGEDAELVSEQLASTLMKSGG